MPPAISSEDEASDIETDMAPAPPPAAAKKQAKPKVEEDDLDDVQANGDAKSDEEEDEDEEGDGEDGADVYVVEAIRQHIIAEDGEPRFQVKWEGYDQESDLTWEPEDNLRESANEVLQEYLNLIGGREKLFEETTKAKGKKRGRPSAGASAPNKRSRRDGHPADSDAPRTVKDGPWKPPPGSWEDEIAQIDAAEDEESGKLMIYLTWNNGQKTQHETKVVYRRCPQKMLQYYERHVRIVKQTVSEKGDTMEE